MSPTCVSKIMLYCVYVIVKTPSICVSKVMLYCVLAVFPQTGEVRENLEKKSGRGKSGNFFLNTDYHEIKKWCDLI